MKRRIVVVGSSNTDMVVRTSRLPLPGETVLGGDFVMAAGGKGANQAAAVARLGGDVALLARLGRDLFGDQTLANLHQEGIDTRWIIRDPQAASGVALIVVDAAGQNSIAVASGANGCMTEEDIERARDLFDGAGVVLLQLEIPQPVVEKAVHLARLFKSLVILNPAPAQVLPEALLHEVDILTPNETEARLMTSCPNPEESASELLKRGARMVIVTLGTQGVLLAQGGNVTRHFPAFPVQAVDTTAAGDAFNGGLAVALEGGESLDAAVRYAQAVAALSVTKHGAQPSLPTAEEVQEFLQRSGN